VGKRRNGESFVTDQILKKKKKREDHKKKLKEIKKRSPKLNKRK